MKKGTPDAAAPSATSLKTSSLKGSSLPERSNDVSIINHLCRFDVPFISARYQIGVDKYCRGGIGMSIISVERPEFIQHFDIAVPLFSKIILQLKSGQFVRRIKGFVLRFEVAGQFGSRNFAAPVRVHLF